MVFPAAKTPPAAGDYYSPVQTGRSKQRYSLYISTPAGVAQSHTRETEVPLV